MAAAAGKKTVKKRIAEDSAATTSETAAFSSAKSIKKIQKKRNLNQEAESSVWYESSIFQLKISATALAFVLRFWRIGLPESVVFDEVHFGKFASHYLQREYYFDSHPPLAKLLFAFVGWLVGYDGRFKFDNIGDSYVTNQVPYVAYRSLAATLGAGTVPLVFGILEHCGFSPSTCFLGASLIVFDNAQIAQTRLILSDAALSFFMVAALYAYVRFREQRHNPFGLKWWIWLMATGLMSSSVISTKYVGVFSFLTIGVAVVVDLWRLTDIRGKTLDQRLALKVVFKHFMARLWALLIVPFSSYLFWFYVHFAILINSGPGDSFMSPEFQATLGANPVAKQALDVHFFDVIRIQSQNTQAYLHSHLHRYPLQYEDGRISSQGQQVNGYPTEDPNNLWQILPIYDIPEEARGQWDVPVMDKQQIMLRHIATDSFSMTHDVASPGFNTNEEFTTTPRQFAYGEMHDFAIFTLDLVSGGEIARTKLSLFRLKHVKTQVAMWLSEKKLPDWGFGQIEINGNKKLDASGTLWTFASVEGLSKSQRKARHTIGDGGDIAPRRGFWTDYIELQGTMFRSNNALTATHPYMSAPITWPFSLIGISFWSSIEARSQIYLIGNFIGWYLEIVAILLFVGLYVFDWMSISREFDWISPYSRKKLHDTMSWFFLGWAFHYFPFFLMGRQSFLHHYLPAHIIGALLTASVIDFITSQLYERPCRFESVKSTKILCYSLLTALIACFVFFAPSTYGMSLSGSAVARREWNNIQLHFKN